ncbi:hypothetical protein VaNZ11_016366 [Volvox africanus]|uniref:Uncharacterized protein n=1 Tax=Volvox africanus TaxID=51714 RepID=A0ABQ5SMW3_9CHLO|nr:hypothetical protein VaNZ11_016366 [Volvox africanus]
MYGSGGEAGAPAHASVCGEGSTCQTPEAEAAESSTVEVASLTDMYIYIYIYIYRILTMIKMPNLALTCESFVYQGHDHTATQQPHTHSPSGSASGFVKISARMARLGLAWLGSAHIRIPNDSL